jgi:hypothetical protein
MQQLFSRFKSLFHDRCLEFSLMASWVIMTAAVYASITLLGFESLIDEFILFLTIKME